MTKTADNFTTDTASNTSFNEYYEFAGDSLEHDSNGNLTSGTLNKYKWDGFNRLREVRDKNGSLIASYLYDADKRRVRKDMNSGTDIDYHYTSWQVLGEYENGSSNPKRQFVYGNFIDEPLVLDVNEDNDEYTTEGVDSRYFYHQNTLYSIYGISNSSGNVVEAYEYDPYGKHWVIHNNDNPLTFTSSDSRTTQGLSNYDNPYLFTARRFDHESKLQYSRRRHYNPISGRFISRDPIGNKSDINQYAGMGNNPITNIDPIGLDFLAVGMRPLNGQPFGLLDGISGGALNPGWHSSIEYWRGCWGNMPYNKRKKLKKLTKPDRDLSKEYIINKLKKYNTPHHQFGAVELLQNTNYGRWEFRSERRVTMGGEPWDYPAHFAWKTVGVSQIVDKSEATYLFIFKTGRYGTLEREWRNIQTAAHQYSFAIYDPGSIREFTDMDIPANAWPNAKYQLTGNNCHAFVKHMMSVGGYDSDFDYPEAFFPGNNPPQDVNDSNPPPVHIDKRGDRPSVQVRN